MQHTREWDGEQKGKASFIFELLQHAICMRGQHRHIYLHLLCLSSISSYPVSLLGSQERKFTITYC
jgi:hypothetical protein